MFMNGDSLIDKFVVGLTDVRHTGKGFLRVWCMRLIRAKYQNGHLVDEKAI